MESIPEVVQAVRNGEGISGSGLQIVRRLRWWHVLVLFLVLSAYWGSARVRPHPWSEIEARGGTQYKAFLEEAKAYKGQPRYHELVIPLNFLTDILVKKWAGKDAEDWGLEQYTELRAENLVLLAGLCVGLMLALSAMRPAAISSSSWSSLAKARPESVDATSPGAESALFLLMDEVASARLRAADLYRRSTLLLAGGIAMAFVGVFVFYYSLSGYDVTTGLAREDLARREYALRDLADLTASLVNRVPSEDVAELLRQQRSYLLQSTSSQARASEVWAQFASRSMRPFGMLVFLEGIAWFLLRQYRALLQDYKAFLRVYLKRANYLIAMRALGEPGTSAKRAALIEGLLAEDVRHAYDTPGDSPRAQRAADGGPVLEALKELTRVLPRVTKDADRVAKRAGAGIVARRAEA